MSKIKGKLIQFFFNLIGKTIYANKAKGITRLMVFKKTTDPDCYQTIAQLLKFYNPTVVYDIGANEGNWTKTLTQHSSSVKEVYLFEPQTKLNNSIVKNLNDVVKTVKAKTFNIGLGDKYYKTSIKGGGPSASVLEVISDYAFANELTDETENIEIYPLDEFVIKHNITIPDLIKIDVQGLEYEILLGAIETLKNCKYLIVELSFDIFYKNQQPLWKILKLLDEIGFLLVDTGFEWRKNYDFNNRLLQIDGIFYNKNLVALD